MSVISSFPLGEGGSVVVPDIYDVVVRTQDDFDSLIASSTWKNATSVCFIGNGGVSKFTKTDGVGIKIPSTVKNIYGINNPIIEVNNFVYNASTNKAVFYYQTLPVSDDYCVEGISVYGIGDTPILFLNCRNLRNCYFMGSFSDTATGITGYSRCYNLINCSGQMNGAGSNSGNYGYSYCENLINCKGVFTVYNYYACEAFSNCKYLVNCDAQVRRAAPAGGVGFSFCSYLVNCTGSAQAQSAAYGFYYCNFLNNCSQSAFVSASTNGSAGLLGGTNLKVDNSTVAATASS